MSRSFCWALQMIGSFISLSLASWFLCHHIIVNFLWTHCHLHACSADSSATLGLSPSIVPQNTQNRLLVGALSPVNHKGLYQGWKRTSVYRLVIQSSSHKPQISLLYNNCWIFHKETNTTQHASNSTEHTNPSRKVKTTLTILKCWPGNTITQILEPVLNIGTAPCINQWMNSVKTRLREWTGLEFAMSQRAVENREKMEETGCEIICGAPVTLVVKG